MGSPTGFSHLTNSVSMQERSKRLDLLLHRWVAVSTWPIIRFCLPSRPRPINRQVGTLLMRPLHSLSYVPAISRFFEFSVPRIWTFFCKIFPWPFLGRHLPAFVAQSFFPPSVIKNPPPPTPPPHPPPSKAVPLHRDDFFGFFSPLSKFSRVRFLHGRGPVFSARRLIFLPNGVRPVTSPPAIFSPEF